MKTDNKQQTLKNARWVLLVIYIAFAIFYSINTPTWEAPDETAHFAFIRDLRQTRQLPVLQDGVLDEAHQPPLYYLLATLATLPVNIWGDQGTFRSNPNFIWAGRGGSDVNINVLGTAQTFPFQEKAAVLHLARLASVFMGAITVLLTIQIGWLIFPTQRLTGLLAASLVAFNPQFLFISGAINNDNLLITAVTGTIWQTLRIAQKPRQWRQWIYLSLWLSTVMLTKLTGAGIVIAVAMAILVIAYHQRSWRIVFIGGGIITTIMLLFTGWWFVRNQMIYGDLLGITKYEQIYAANIRSQPIMWSQLQEWFRVQFRSFWGIFGWMTLSAPNWYFTLIRVLLATVVIGWIALIAKKIWRKWSRFQKAAIGFLVLSIILQQLTILNVLTRCNASCYQGRYLFPVISAIAILSAIGLINLAPERLKTGAALSIATIMAGLALFMALFIIKPAYTITPLPGSQLWFIQNKLDTHFGNQLRLRGHDIEAKDDALNIKLYWQSSQPIDFDYSAFVHLKNEDGLVVAQKDVGIGQTQTYLPTTWAVGDLVADEHPIELPPDLPNGTYQVQVGVYNWVSGERLLTNFPEENQDFVTISEITFPIK